MNRRKGTRLVNFWLFLFIVLPWTTRSPSVLHSYSAHRWQGFVHADLITSDFTYHFFPAWQSLILNCSWTSNYKQAVQDFSLPKKPTTPMTSPCVERPIHQVRFIKATCHRGNLVDGDHHHFGLPRKCIRNLPINQLGSRWFCQRRRSRQLCWPLCSSVFFSLSFFFSHQI